jgi:ketosteroid isomerase-like protein
MRLALLSALFLTPAVACAPVNAAPAGFSQSPAAIADGLLAADRAFAAAASGKPAAEALDAMIADDVVMFIIPAPTQAPNRAEAQAIMGQAFGSEPVTLRWAPVRGGVSADGQHGFTYGFMDQLVAGKPPKLGKYVAYWIRQADGWRAASLQIVPRADGDVVTAMRAPALPDWLVPPTTDAALIESYRASLDKVERAFSDESQTIGLGAGFKKYGSADAMNVGGGADFVYGNVAIGEAQGGDAPNPSPLRWAPDGVVVASSGDLGFTYGYLVRNGPTPPGRLARIPWVTIWRRNSPSGPWLYVAE